MVLFDTTVFSLYLDPSAKSPVNRAADRVTKLIHDVASRRDVIVIPTPVLSEVLAVSDHDKIQSILDRLDRVACFRFADFGRRAAVENAMIEKLSKTKLKHAKASLGNRQKLKVDRQIVAIAKVEGVNLIYSDDRDVQQIGMMFDVQVKGLADVDSPAIQTKLDL